MTSHKWYFLTLAALCSTIVSIVPLAQAQVDLNVELKQALCSQDWQKTLRVLDRMIVVAPQYATEIRLYRGRIAVFAQKKVKFPNWTTGCFSEETSKTGNNEDNQGKPPTSGTPTTPPPINTPLTPLPNNSIPITLDNKTLECNFFTDNGQITFSDLAFLTDNGKTLSEAQLSKAMAGLQKIINYWQNKEVNDTQLQQFKEQLLANYSAAINTINLVIYEGRSGSFVGQARETENLQKEVAQEASIGQQVQTYCQPTPK